VSRVLYLIRHGRSDLDARDMSVTPRGDQYDPPLSGEGREQAELLARRLLVMDLHPSAVYSSPLRRARETVAPYAERANVAVTYEDDLMEAHIGGWEGVPFEEILADDADLLHRIRNQEAIWHRAPRGERTDDFRARIVGGIEQILTRHDEGDLVIVAHGGVVNAYCGHVLGLENPMFFLPENTSLNSVVVDGEHRTVRFLNDIAHLTEPQLFDDR
jgi:broad specificity phosphatase PhoE